MRPFTTPGALRFGLVVLVTGTLLFGIVATRSVIERLDAAHAVGHVATPQLVASQDVYASLADADATASSAFLDAARETPEIQARYRADLDNASQQLADMARRSGSAQARAAVTTMTNELPVYADLVATAHANSLQALLVGGAYLHEASQLMRNTILPAATLVYEDASAQLAQGDRRGSSQLEVAAVVLLGVVLVVLLAAMLAFLALRMRRIVNVGLVAALLIIIGMTTTVTVTFVKEQRSLQRSQSGGADPLRVLSAARILTLRTFSDENLDLIERGAASSYMPDFTALANALSNNSATGLLDTRYVGPVAVHDYEAYATAHEDVRNANDVDGDYQKAVNIATTTEATAAVTLDTELQREIRGARTALERNANQAASGLALVELFTVLLALAATAAIVLGLRPRIREYR
jgi:hypothetical protein